MKRFKFKKGVNRLICPVILNVFKKDFVAYPKVDSTRGDYAYFIQPKYNKDSYNMILEEMEEARKIYGYSKTSQLSFELEIDELKNIIKSNVIFNKGLPKSRVYRK